MDPVGGGGSARRLGLGLGHGFFRGALLFQAAEPSLECRKAPARRCSRSTGTSEPRGDEETSALAPKARQGRSPAMKPAAKAMRSARDAGRYHAVVIVPRGASCTAALDCARRRYLSAEAPRLPLAACDRHDQCQCVYRHHADRRDDPRRDDESSGARRGPGTAAERRTGRGRRETD